jgi:hypothetical protein
MKAIRTKFFVAGDKKPNRIIAKDGDGNNVEFTCRADCTFDMNHYLAALKLCAKMNWRGQWHEGQLGQGEYVFVPEAPPAHHGVIKWEHRAALAEVGPPREMAGGIVPLRMLADPLNL